MSASGAGQRDGGRDSPSRSVRWPSLQANEYSTGFSAGCQFWALCAGNILSKMSQRTSQQCPADWGHGAAGFAICLQPLRGNYIRVSQVLVQGGCQMLFPFSPKAISIFSVLAELHRVAYLYCLQVWERHRDRRQGSVPSERRLWEGGQELEVSWGEEWGTLSTTTEPREGHICWLWHLLAKG